MAKDTRTYIRLHDGMPDHPKIAGLSDAAFRLQVEALCYCSRYLTDGHLPAAILRKLGTEDALAELIDAGLIDVDGDRHTMHDYLSHQRSADEVRAYSEMKSGAGHRGNHQRWHVERNQPAADCPECLAESQKSSQVRSQQRSQTDRKRSQSTEAETETERTTTTRAATGDHGGNVKPLRPRDPLFDSLVAAFGIDYDQTTRSTKTLIGKLTAELREIGAQPEDVKTRHDRYARKWPRWELTPPALVKHWHELGDQQAAATARGRLFEQ